MKSYIKIYGPPVLKAIKALEKIAIDMPQVCINNTIINQTVPAPVSGEAVRKYFDATSATINDERCGKIISKSAENLGEYDFFFEWFRNPTPEELNELIEKIDTVLTPLGCKYSITSKSR